ncbi:hypothetical protein CWM47_01615 [Spirosoma pollinicola]|uniref:Uncharacterized protein n=2 Tax=Spirosoma pollinicola TaxID=2057025 RepID=A0A2K8YSM4_9BACT|nr:hypothetical protein CWM47_01615 [Spirosoma pollinicola]
MNQPKHKPNRRTGVPNHEPRWAQRLLRWFHPENTLEEVEGDLYELYAYWYERSGQTQATVRYVLNVLSVLPPFVCRRKPRHEQAKTTLFPTPRHATKLFENRLSKFEKSKAVLLH